MGTFDEARVQYLRNKAKLNIAYEDVQAKKADILEAKANVDAYELLGQNFNVEIDAAEERRKSNVAALQFRKKQLEELIKFQKVSASREEFNSAITEDLDELYRLRNASDENSKNQFNEIRNRLNIIFMLAGKYDKERKTTNEKGAVEIYSVLDEYLDIKEQFETIRHTYNEKMENMFLPDDYDKLSFLLNDPNVQKERKDQLVSKIAALTSDENFMDEIASLSDAIKEANDGIEDEGKKLEVAKAEKKNIEKVYKQVKELKIDADIKERLMAMPEVKNYFEEEERITAAEENLNLAKHLNELIIPDTFTELYALSKDEREKAETVINSIIKVAAEKDGVNAKVRSLSDYYDVLKEQENISNILKTPKEHIPEDEKELMKLKDAPSITARFVGLSDRINAVTSAQKNLENSKKAYYEDYAKNTVIPFYMADLKNLQAKEPEKYEYVKKHIDGLIAKADIPGIKTLDDYFAREAAEAEEEKVKLNLLDRLSKANKNLLKDKYKTAADVKHAIRELIINDNKKKSKNENSELLKAIKNAEKNLDEANKNLVKFAKEENEKLAKAHDETIEGAKNVKKKIDTNVAEIKAYIKKSIHNRKIELQSENDIIASKLDEMKKEHKKNKAVFEKAVDQVLANAIKVCDDKIKEHEKNCDKHKADAKKFSEELKNKEKAIFTKVKEENSKTKKSREYEDAEKAAKELKSADKELASKGLLIKKYIKAYNDKQKSLLKKEKIDIDKSFESGHNDYVNATIMGDLEENKSKARKAYFGATLKSKGLNFVADILSKAVKQVETGVVITGKALILGERETLERQRTALADERNRMQYLNAVENANTMSLTQSGNLSTESARTIVQTRERMVDDEREIAEATNRIMNLSKCITDLESKEHQRLADYEDSIIGSPEEINTENSDVIVKAAKFRTEIFRSVAPNDNASIQMAQAAEDIAKEQAEVMAALDEETRAKIIEREKTITEYSESLKGLFTETNLSRIDKGIDITIKAVKLIKKIVSKYQEEDEAEAESEDKENEGAEAENEEKAGDTSEAEDEEEVTRDSIIEGFKALVDKLPDGFDDESKSDPHFINQIMEIMPELVEKLNGINDSIAAMAAKATREADVTKRYFKIQENEQNNYRDYLVNASRSKEANLLEFQTGVLDGQIDVINSGTAHEIDLLNNAKNEVVVAKAQAEEEYSNQQKLKDEMEANNAIDSEKLFDEREKLINDFSATLIAGEKNVHSKPSLTVEDINNRDLTGLAFLSKLTGMEFNENTSAIDVMRNFEKVYINGINAVTYFGLEDDFSKAYTEDLKLERAGSENKQSKAAKDFIALVSEHALDIQAGLRFITTKNPEERKSLSKSSLAGQLIAIEDGDMHLNPVSITSPEIESYKKGLKAPAKPEKASKEEQANYDRDLALYNSNLEIYQNNKGIMEYNNNNSRMYGEFNDMRLAVANMELGKDKQNDKDKTVAPITKQREKISMAILGGKGL